MWHRALAPTLLIDPPPDLVDAAAEPRMRKLADGLAELCRRNGVPFLETRTFVQDSEAWRQGAAAGDGTHPDEAGYAAPGRKSPLRRLTGRG